MMTGVLAERCYRVWVCKGVRCRYTPAMPRSASRLHVSSHVDDKSHYYIYHIMYVHFNICILWVLAPEINEYYYLLSSTSFNIVIHNVKRSCNRWRDSQSDCDCGQAFVSLIFKKTWLFSPLPFNFYEAKHTQFTFNIYIFSNQNDYIL